MRTSYAQAGQRAETTTATTTGVVAPPSADGTRGGCARHGRVFSLVRMSVALPPASAGPNAFHLTEDSGLRLDLGRFFMVYEFGLKEILTKVDILQAEMRLINGEAPIEHVSSRLKSLASLAEKLQRKGLPFSTASVQESIHDIAGIRIVCSFVSDVYSIADMLLKQSDVELVAVKDYIAAPKPNGYRSLHLLVDTPVNLSDRVATARVEVQLRTVAMDFWASLEHKIYYKWKQQVPNALRDELLEAALSAAALDETMQRLHRDSGRLLPAERTSRTRPR